MVCKTMYIFNVLKFKMRKCDFYVFLSCCTRFLERCRRVTSLLRAVGCVRRSQSLDTSIALTGTCPPKVSFRVWGSKHHPMGPYCCVGVCPETASWLVRQFWQGSLVCPIPVLLSLALVLGLEVSSRTNFESLALVLALKVKSLALRVKSLA